MMLITNRAIIAKVITTKNLQYFFHFICSKYFRFAKFGYFRMCYYDEITQQQVWMEWGVFVERVTVSIASEDHLVLECLKL